MNRAEGLPGRPPATTWERMRARVNRYAPELIAPQPGGGACCVVCRGPARPGYARCYQCGTHRADAQGMLADAVVPISYAVQGGGHAAALRAYKSDPPDAGARARLRALLLVFLRGHGACVWRYAAIPPPARVAVVPGGQGRPGPHPLTTLVLPYLTLTEVVLAVRPGEPMERAVNPWRFAAGRGAAGASVLLLDDTWVSGASAQSAAVALRMAGARHVAVVVLARHLNPADPGSRPMISALAAAPYDPEVCAVHGRGGQSGYLRMKSTNGI